jgi:hypothetical protein
MRNVGIGFVVACVLGAVGATGILALEKGAWNKELRSVMRVCCALGAVPTLMWAVTSPDLPGLVFVVRWWMVLGFFVSVRTTSTFLPRQMFAWGGVVFLAAHLLLYFVASAAPSLFGWAFEIGVHQHLGQSRRFIGWVGNPAALGTWAFLAASLASRCHVKWIAILGPVAGVVISAFTLSIATLAIPAFLMIAFIRSVAWRLASAGACLLMAIMVLYMQPLTLDVGETHFELSKVHSKYDHNQNGPRFMPIKSMRLGNATFRFHVTVYGYQAAAGIKCFMEHPVLGVGLERFARSCSATTMNTYGSWSSHRRAHNQFVQWTSEMGALGLLLTFAAMAFARQRLPWNALGRWQWSAFAALVVASFGGEMLATIPVWGWLAFQSQSPEPAGREASLQKTGDTDR